MIERLEGLAKEASTVGHCMSGVVPYVDVLCMCCIDCGKEIIIDRDNGKVYIDDAIVNKCEY